MHAKAQLDCGSRGAVSMSAALFCSALIACDGADSKALAHHDTDAGMNRSPDSGSDDGVAYGSEWVEPGFRLYMDRSLIMLAARPKQHLKIESCSGKVRIEKRSGD